jgi:hypothetical protein
MRNYEDTKKFCEFMTKQAKENRCYDIYEMTGTEQLDDFRNNAKLIEENIMQEEHRWYITSVNVYKYFGFFVGVLHVSTIKNENDGYEDIGVYLKFLPVKPVEKITYEIWNKKE